MFFVFILAFPMKGYKTEWYWMDKITVSWGKMWFVGLAAISLPPTICPYRAPTLESRTEEASKNNIHNITPQQRVPSWALCCIPSFSCFGLAQLLMQINGLLSWGLQKYFLVINLEHFQKKINNTFITCSNRCIYLCMLQR